jgi:hypothetical protein
MTIQEKSAIPELTYDSTLPLRPKDYILPTHPVAIASNMEVLITIIAPMVIADSSHV